MGRRRPMRIEGCPDYGITLLLLQCLLGRIDEMNGLLSELAREGQIQLWIVYSGKGRWSPIRIVEPSEEVPVDKELLA